jgi:hypothetical protein
MQNIFIRPVGTMGRGSIIIIIPTQVIVTNTLQLIPSLIVFLVITRLNLLEVRDLKGPKGSISNKLLLLLVAIGVDIIT